MFIHGDWFEIGFPNYIFDGVVTDYPYKGCIRNKLGERDFSYSLFAEKSFREVKRDGFLITFSNFVGSLDLRLHLERAGWIFNNEMVWDKAPRRTWIAKSKPTKQLEYILFFRKGKFRYDFRTGERKPRVNRKSFGGTLKQTNPNDRKYSLATFPDLITDNIIREKLSDANVFIPNEIEKIHPVQKPIAFSFLFKTVIEGTKFNKSQEPLSYNTKHYVLDPFCGSAALLYAFSDKQSVGIDIKDYKIREKFDWVTSYEESIQISQEMRLPVGKLDNFL